MEKVRQILKRKSQHVASIHPTATVYEAIQLMAALEIGALMVMDGPRVVGMFSERDYVRHGILKGRLSKDTEVREIMATRLVQVDPDASIEECMERMTTERVRHLPVMEGERLIGIISMGDLVKAVIDEQRFMIRQLETYIGG